MSGALAAVPSPVVRVLLVEDDPHDTRVLRAMILRSSEPRFELEQVATIAEACDQLATREFDLVILDLGLPDASELDGLARIQECSRDIPLIVLTGRDDEALALEALHGGAEDYLVKGTVERNGLIRSLRYAMERHRSVRALARVTKELQHANAALERLTLLDPLTDVLNRRGLQQALTREIEQLKRENAEVLILLIDIDEFKQVNDRFGHAVGDVALKEIARKLKASVRAIDYVARLGGDEFMLLLPNAKSSEAARIAERTRLAVATTSIQHSGGTLSFTASIGALMLTADTPSVDEVLAQTHQLLRRSKDLGKNRISYAGSEFDDTDRRRRHEADMCASLAAGHHLFSVKQPILSLGDEKVVGWEFLSRYQNGHLEMPDNFFRVCSENNILTLVDHHCLRKAVHAALELGGKPRFHFNLFPSTLINVPTEHLIDGFPDPIPEGTFCVEISEQQIIGDPSYLIQPVTALRQRGVLIAIDDVGFGNSCLESLVILAPDIIKLDKRCVIGLADDEQRIGHMKRYLTMARTLGAEIIAEGVETERDRDLLRDLGVPFGQGYYWGRPE